MSTPMKYRRGISDGIHTFRLTEFSEQMGGSGHPYWRYNMVCVDKEDKDQSVTLFVSLSPAARFKQEEFLDAVGAPDEGQGYGEAFEGKLVRAEISHDKYKDDKEALQVITYTETEIEMFRKYSDYYGYAFYVMQTMT